MSIQQWEAIFSRKILEMEAADPAHDFLHFQRVVSTAKKLCKEHSANINIVMPSAWLHDYVLLSKDDPNRSRASSLSAKAAIEYLETVGYPMEFHKDIYHAIESHSFSANIAPRSLEAQIVQDADRLDALGAIGIARCFSLGGMLNRTIYSRDDPFCISRLPNDKNFNIDHFYSKLFRIADTLQTSSGRTEGQRRVIAMKEYLQQLKTEIGEN